MVKELLIGAAAVAVLGVGLVSLLQPSIVKRLRLDVVLEANGQTLSGSTVWEMTATRQFNPLGNSLPIRNEVRGEAIPLRLSETEAFFVLRRGVGGGSTRTYGALLWDCGLSDLDALRAFEGSCDVRAPQIVSARGDLSSSEVPKLGLLETGPIALGDARIVSAKVTVTDEPITTGLAETFPWVASIPLALRPGSRPGEGTFSRRELYEQDFTTEEGWE